MKYLAILFSLLLFCFSSSAQTKGVNIEACDTTINRMLFLSDTSPVVKHFWRNHDQAG